MKRPSRGSGRRRRAGIPARAATATASRSTSNTASSCSVRELPGTEPLPRTRRRPRRSRRVRRAAPRPGATAAPHRADVRRIGDHRQRPARPDSPDARSTTSRAPARCRAGTAAGDRPRSGRAATTSQPSAARPSTVAAPIPRAAPVTSATGVIGPRARRRARPRRRRRAPAPAPASSRSPSSAEAPAGSPSTPLGLSGRTPPLAELTDQLRIGAVLPGLAAPSATRSGRMASISEVSTRPACASPLQSGAPAEHVAALIAKAAPLRGATRLGVAAVGRDEHDPGEGGRSPSGRARRAAARSPRARSRSSPGSPSCSPLEP